MAERHTTWKEDLQQLHLPRWHELPDLALYMDQLVTLVERYTAPFKVTQREERGITPAMVNNYVKKQLLPPPERKKYGRRHLSRLIIITILKQSFELPVIQKGLDWQRDSGDYTLAYDQFCQQLEETVQLFLSEEPQEVYQFAITKPDYRPIQLATISLVAKLVAENTLVTLTNEKESTHE